MRLERVKIGEIAKVKGGKRLPHGYDVQDEPTDHPYLRVVDFDDNGLNPAHVKFISNEVHEKIRRYTITDKDIYVSIAGTIGRVGIVPALFSGANLTENAAQITDIGASVDAPYLYYFLKGHTGQELLKSKAGGTSQPKLALYRLAEIEFPKPSFQAQRRIADTLSAYDDLIENNRRRIALLEEAARLLYREWFVHFRFPGHEHIKVIDGLPVGWVRRTLVELAEVVMGQSPKSQFYNDAGEGLPFHQGVTDYGFRFVSHRIYSTAVTKIAESGDILVSVRAPVGRINITRDKIVLGRGLAAIRSRTEHQSLLFYALKNHFYAEDIIGTGAIYAATNKKELEGQIFLEPPPMLLWEFEDQVSTIDLQIACLESQDQKLTQARDLLLPRLMNGGSQSDVRAWRHHKRGCSMAVTPVNSEDRLVQATFAEHLEGVLGWDSIYAWNQETFGPNGTLGRADTKEAVLTRDLRAALERLNPDLPASAMDNALRQLTVYDVSRSMVQHNRDFYRLLRSGVPVEYRDSLGRQKTARARVIDFDNAPGCNRFLAVRELKLTGIRTPNYNRRADLVCFVNGLPLVFIELKAVYKNIREGFDDNLSDYMDENVIAHAFHHNAFLVVSNGDLARYGSITSEWGHFAEWKRLDEADEGSLDAEVLLNGMLAHDRLLDMVENFILFDDSKPGATRMVIARNHQVLGVNRAVESVSRQERLKLEFPPERRLRHRVVELPLESRAPVEYLPAPAMIAEAATPYIPKGPVNIVERSHPDLGRLGVFWHTQGSGKSYSMAFFAEKVRRKLEGNFTFLLMTDRNDLDSQIYKTFIGCGIADDQTPRAASGDDLENRLSENHRYVFSLIHKFNKDVDPKRPYSERDDIIVISDEAHRTQAGRLARNMRLALPNASFIGFTGTPLFKQDQLTKRIFGDYVSRYDFKRSEEDGSTVKLVYENRGEKLGVARTDLNDRIATKIDEADLDPDQESLLDKLLGQDYEVITADERLEKIAADFVEHCATRWQSRQVDAGLHRQDHVRPNAAADRSKVASESRRRPWSG